MIDGPVVVSQPPIRVVIADDHAMVAQALGALLDLESDVEVVDVVTDPSAVAVRTATTQADVVLLDVVMGATLGFDPIPDILAQRPAAHVCMVTAFGKAGYAQRALAAGAQGFIVKESSANHLHAAIRAVAAGETFIDPELLAPACTLTPRQIDILRAASTGHTTRRIAHDLYISQGTVRNTLSQAMAKLGATSSADAVRQAEALGWL